ncbi:MAG: hypothetical protein GY754_12160 [bacterium]|nr:hypothetical protein [bacterium]
MRKKIIVFMYEAGNAHTTTANNFKTIMNNYDENIDVEILDITKQEKKSEPFKKIFGITGTDLWNYCLRNDHIRIANFFFYLVKPMMRFTKKKSMEHLRKVLKRTKPDLVISVVHNLNDLIAHGTHELNIPFGIIATDLMDIAERPAWFGPETCQYAKFICFPTHEAIEQGNEMNAGESCVLSHSLLINDHFFSNEYKAISKTDAQRMSGIDPALFTVLISMGGSGSKNIFHIIDALEKLPGRIQVIPICGRDQKTYDKIKNNLEKFKNNVVPVGFTDTFHIWLKSSDVLIAKPGTLTTWEALASGTPIIYFVKKAISLETVNIQFLKKHQLGSVCSTLKTLTESVNKYVESPEMLNGIKENIRTLSIENPASVIIDTVNKYI